jgi:superoxide reductase
MVEVHYIQFLILEISREGTGSAYRMAKLLLGNAPEARFALQKGEKAVAVYAYCNLHGLWKADIEG